MKKTANITANISSNIANKDIVKNSVAIETSITTKKKSVSKKQQVIEEKQQVIEEKQQEKQQVIEENQQVIEENQQIIKKNALISNIIISNKYLLQFDILSNYALCNSLRRMMIAEVPILAIDKIIIYKNSGVIHDEIISHRLGLIPISSSEKIVPDKKYLFQMDVKFDEKKADVNGAQSIYSDDLLPFSDDLHIQKNIIITKIKEGQELKLEAFAELGIGKKHVKWCPSAGISYTDNLNNTLTFYVETNESLDAVTTFRNSIPALKNKLEEFRKNYLNEQSH